MFTPFIIIYFYYFNCIESVIFHSTKQHRSTTTLLVFFYLPCKSSVFITEPPNFVYPLMILVQTSQITFRTHVKMYRCIIFQLSHTRVTPENKIGTKANICIRIAKINLKWNQYNSLYFHFETTHFETSASYNIHYGILAC